ncbi:MAG: SCO family protein [Pseudomonadota bacterium]
MKIYAWSAVGLISAMLGGLVYLAFFKTPEDALAQCRGGVVATGNASIGGPFELVAETGETVTDADVIVAPTLVYFGYTFCPDVCPLDAYRNGEAADLLAEQGYDVNTVFITIDPERDTPEQLAFFTEAMHPDMLGLTGSEAQVAAASKAYKTYYRKQDGDPEYYLVDHSTFTYLMLPNAGFADFFRREASAQQIAERTACFIDATS